MVHGSRGINTGSTCFEAVIAVQWYWSLCLPCITYSRREIWYATKIY